MSSITQIQHTSQNEAVAAALRTTLADTFALYMKTHAFHWNLTGAQFVTLHALFEQQYTDMWQATDELAERIRSLGEFAPWNYEQMIKGSQIESATQSLNTDKMLHILIIDHEHAAKSTRAALKVAQEHEDDVSADLLTARLAFHEKQLWMLKSTAQ